MVRNCNVGAALVLATLIFLQASINSSTAGICALFIILGLKFSCNCKYFGTRQHIDIIKLSFYDMKLAFLRTTLENVWQVLA